MDNEFVDISTSHRLQLGFGTGHVLNDVCASLWFTYFLVYFHLVLEFTATQSGNLMLIGQVVDALATPFVGYHSDHTDNLISARYGKRKIWHLFGKYFCHGLIIFTIPHHSYRRPLLDEASPMDFNGGFASIISQTPIPW